MARFPLQQAKVLELAESIVNGLTGNSTIYPDPPVSAADLQVYLSACKKARDEVAAAREAYSKALAVKYKELAELVLMMKKDIRYAENIVDFDDDKLRLIGWSGRRGRSQ